MSDNEILQLSYTKPTIFAELFDRHHKRLLFIARKALGSKDEAEDVVQEAFVRIYKYGRKFTENGSGRKADFRHWSNAILKNCIIDKMRKRKNKEIALSEEMESVLESENNFSENESINYVDSILSRLGKTSSEILNLRFVLGKSFKEIGRILGISSGAARIKAFRAKKEFVKMHKELNFKT